MYNALQKGNLSLFQINNEIFFSENIKNTSGNSYKKDYSVNICLKMAEINPIIDNSTFDLTPIEYVPVNKLPLVKDILNSYIYLEKKSNINESKFKTKIESLVSCNNIRNTSKLECLGETGCQENNPCIVFQVSRIWQKAGFEIVTARTIKKTITNIVKDHSNFIYNVSHRKSWKGELLKNKICEQNSKYAKLCEIGVQHLEDSIKNNKFR